MAGKKGVAVALQTEVNNEEDWVKLLEKEGLVVVDVYSEWCGPCVGMVGNLKKLKLEIGSDYFHLAIAKSDGIEALKRFTNRSEPTWMFIASGHMVNLMFGADAPRLMRLIGQELDRETSVLKGERQRKTIPFDELTQEEKDRQEEFKRKEEAERQREAKELAEALEELKIRNLTRFARLLADKTVMVYFPHMVDEHGTCSAAFKMLAQYDQVLMAVHDQMEVQLTEDMLPEVFYDCNIQLSDAFLKELVAKPCLVSLLMYHGVATTDSGTSLPVEIGQVEDKLGSFTYGHLSHTEPPVVHTVAYNFQQTMDNGEVWPGIWTPLTYLCKASAVKAMFPHVLVTMDFKEEQLPPPRYCMIFDASRANEVNDVIEEFPEDILNIGFFDGVDGATAKKVAKNMKQLEKLGADKIKQTKMVMAVAKKTSDPLLAFSQLTPLYISPDTKIGNKDCNQFFPPADVFEDDMSFEGEEGEEDEGEGGEGDGEEGAEGEGEEGAEGEEHDLAVDVMSDEKSLTSHTSGDIHGSIQQNGNDNPTEQ